MILADCCFAVEISFKVMYLVIVNVYLFIIFCTSAYIMRFYGFYFDNVNIIMSF